MNTVRLPAKLLEKKSQVARKKDEREEYVETIKDIIREKMTQAHLSCTVLGRHKNFSGIYQKMMAQQVSFEEVYDILGFRIILDTVQQCYEALGIIHSVWKPIPKRQNGLRITSESQNRTCINHYTPRL